MSTLQGFDYEEKTDDVAYLVVGNWRVSLRADQNQLAAVSVDADIRRRFTIAYLIWVFEHFFWLVAVGTIPAGGTDEHVRLAHQVFEQADVYVYQEGASSHVGYRT